MAFFFLFYSSISSTVPIFLDRSQISILYLSTNKIFSITIISPNIISSRVPNYCHQLSLFSNRKRNRKKASAYNYVYSTDTQSGMNTIQKGKPIIMFMSVHK